MTRARTHTWAVGVTPLLQPLLEAVLCAFVSLVQGVRATLGMRLKWKARDWHTDDPQEALPQAKPGIQFKEPTTPTKSFSDLTRESFVASTQGLVARQKDARVKSEHDSPVDAAPPTPVIPGAGALAPKTRNPGATRFDISISRFWVPALRGFATPAGMTIRKCALSA